MIKIFHLLFIVLTLQCGVLHGSTKGLYIKDGYFYKGGKIVNAHGVNYFDVFLRINGAAIKGVPDDLSWKKGLETLSKNGIPFIRFSVFPFYPIDWKLYFDDKEAYFANLDKVVKEAERLNIGLIPSIFWMRHTIQDLLKEPVNSIRDENSGTRRFMRSYAREIITRYKDSPAIWGWEFGNEFALACDLPGEKAGLPKTITSLGMPAVRTINDKLKRTDIYPAYVEFAKIAKELDRSRPVFTGDSIIRSNAYNNKYRNQWVKDSIEESEKILIEDNPDPIDTITIHAYKDGVLGFKWSNSIMHTFLFLEKVSDKIKKPIFLGEWGIPNDMNDAENIKCMEEMIGAIKSAKIQLSAVWVFDFKDQKNEPKWSITQTNNRNIYFEKLKELNGQK